MFGGHFCDPRENLWIPAARSLACWRSKVLIINELVKKCLVDISGSAASLQHNCCSKLPGFRPLFNLECSNSAQILTT